MARVCGQGRKSHGQAFDSSSRDPSSRLSTTDSLERNGLDWTGLCRQNGWEKSPVDGVHLGHPTHPSFLPAHVPILKDLEKVFPPARSTGVAPVTRP